MIDLSSYLWIIYIGLFVMLSVSFYLFSIFIENYREIKKDSNAKPKKLRKYPFVSIIMTTYNEETTIKKTIESLLNLNYPKNKMEIIVIDQSKDNTFKILKSIKDKRLKCKWVSKFGVPNEKSACLNIALKMAKGDFIVTQDADSFIEKNALLKMLPLFEKEKNLGAVIPNMKVHNPKNWVQKFQYVEYLTVSFMRKLWEFVGATFVTPGPFSIFRRKALEKVGLYFDEYSLTEDLEIALRLLDNGFKIGCCLGAEVTTVCPDTINALFKQRVRQNLGTLYDFKKYKHLFSPKYGELGTFVLPITLATPLLLISCFGFMFANVIANFLNKTFLINKVGTSILIEQSIANLFTFRFIYSDIFYLMNFALLLGFLFFGITRKYGKSFIHWAKDFFVYWVFISISGFMYVVFWLTAFYRFFRKKIIWEKYDKKRIKW